MMDSYLSSVTLECKKKKNVEYLTTIIFCALCACFQENLPYFATKVRQLWVDTSRLSSRPLSCVIVCSFLWFAAVMLEVGRMLNLWMCSVCDPFLVQCSAESREALAHFSFSRPGGCVVKGISSDVSTEGGGAAVPCHCLPAPACQERCVLFTSWQGQGVLGAAPVVRAETVGMYPGANLQVCRDLLQFKA